MPVVIDGNNLLHRLPPEQRSRADVRRRALDLVRHESVRLVVVFDGPPPAGSPTDEHLGKVHVRYSGAASADDVILKLLPDGRAAAQWVVVTNDRRLGDLARSKGAGVRTLAEWLGRRGAPKKRDGYESKLSSHAIADWERYFSTGGEPEDS